MALPTKYSVTIFDDTYTEGSDTSIDAHSPDSYDTGYESGGSAAWSETNGDANNDQKVIASTDRARGVKNQNDNLADFENFWIPANTDFLVIVDWMCPGHNAYGWEVTWGPITIMEETTGYNFALSISPNLSPGTWNMPYDDGTYSPYTAWTSTDHSLITTGHELALEWDASAETFYMYVNGTLRGTRDISATGISGATRKSLRIILGNWVTNTVRAEATRTRILVEPAAAGADVPVQRFTRRLPHLRM